MHVVQSVYFATFGTTALDGVGVTGMLGKAGPSRFNTLRQKSSNLAGSAQHRGAVGSRSTRLRIALRHNELCGPSARLSWRMRASSVRPPSEAKSLVDVEETV